jgi:hypothetical protein
MARDRVDQERLRLLRQDKTRLLALLAGDAASGIVADTAPDASATVT